MAIGPAAVPEEFTAALGARRARLGPIGARVVFFETTSSTNDVADRLATDGAPHGTVVFADAQESGRGRLGRTWFSPPGAGLYASVVLRPENLSNPGRAGFHEDENHRRSGVGAGFSRPLPRTSSVSFASAVSLTAGVAIAEGIRAACGLDVTIKWPNDLVVDRRKLCGILAEASSRSGDLQHVILGYGINVRRAAYPPDFAHRATALESELGREVDPGLLLAETLASLAEWLERARLDRSAIESEPLQSATLTHLSTNAGGFAAMLDRWRQLSPSSVGADVEVLRPAGTWAAAVTAGVADDGALLVTVAGQTERVIAGEVRWS